MTEHSQDETLLRRYLLGQLSLEEQVQVEARLFLQDEYEQLAEAVETELIDDYAYHDLSETERQEFNDHFLARSDRHEDLRIARALKRFVNSQPEVINPLVAQPTDTRNVSPFPVQVGFWSRMRNRSPAAMALAAGVLIVFFVIIWFIFQSARKEREVPFQAQQPRPAATELPSREPVQPQDEQVRNVDKPAQNQGSTGQNERYRRPRSKRSDEALEVSTPPNGSGLVTTATFIIPPGDFVRGEANMPVVSISSETKAVALKLPVPENDSSQEYRATLQSRSQTIYTWSRLTAEADEEIGKIVLMKLPSKLLHEQTYIIKLRGMGNPTEVNYGFQVRKR
jgi:hypothetical protein